MRNIFFILIICSFIFTACKNKKEANGIDTSLINDEKNPAIIELVDSVYDFGTVSEGEIVKATFTIKNSGTGPLLISDAKPSCGCTVADSPKEPISPDKTATITATFNTTNKQGLADKKITITSNAKNGKKVLTIKGTVQ